MRTTTGERVFAAFDDAYRSDDDRSIGFVLNLYKTNPAAREGIDQAFITMCGYSLKTLSGNGRRDADKTGHRFADRYSADQGDVDSWEYLLNIYNTKPEHRYGINQALKATCGWSLPTLMKLAGLIPYPQDTGAPTRNKSTTTFKPVRIRRKNTGHTGLGSIR